MLAAGTILLVLNNQQGLVGRYGGCGRTWFLLSVSSRSQCIFQVLGGSYVTVFLRCGLDDTQKKVTDEKDPMVHLESVYQELLSKKEPEEVQPTKTDPCSCPSLVPQGPVAEESPLPDQEEQAEQGRSPSLPAARPHQSPPQSVIIKEPVEFVPEEEICKNRLSEEELRNIPRFSSYQPGEPNKVC